MDGIAGSAKMHFEMPDPVCRTALRKASWTTRKRGNAADRRDGYDLMFGEEAFPPSP
jgi:hypothetical protein